MADSQRKTANLFDADTWYGAYKISDGIYQTNRNTWYSLVAKPFTNDDIGKTFCFAANVEPSSGNARFAAVINGVQINGQYTDNRCIVTFTVQTIDDKILFDYGSGSTTVTTVSNIMLNTGSQPLPYEPYGWLHSLRKLTTSTDTITTLPADVYADGNNATVGLKGNMSQTGTPTPQNPIQPSECGERTGNLFDYQTMGGTIKGYYLDNEGGIQPNSLAAVTDYIPCNGGKFCLAKVGGISPSICLYDSNKQYIYGQAYNTSSGSDKQTIIVNSSVNASYVRFTYFFVGTGVVDDLSAIMLNTGSTPLPYEPYGYKTPISSASTTTPVYLEEVESTRLIKKIIFTGSEDENWSAQAAGGGATRFRYTLANSVQADTAHLTSICTHLPLGVEGGTWNTDNIYTISSNYLWLRLDSSITTVASLKSWLAQQYANGTPVTVWYVLATPTTGIVNEPIRKIGDYADTVSGITIPTITGKDTVDVETTLKPSEVSLAYTGWHDATVKEWDGSEWQ